MAVKHAPDVEQADHAALDEAIRQARQAHEHGVRWLDEQISSEGVPRESANALAQRYYRLPWAFAVAGASERATSVLRWIDDNALTPSGDLREGLPRLGWTEKWSSYPLASLATGAWYLERFDVARRIMNTLCDFQDPASGGAFAQRPELRTSSRQDLFPTAQLGMTALLTGHDEVAARAYSWVRRLFLAQPDLPQCLYSGWDNEGLITRLPPDLAFELITRFNAPRQAFYNPGIAAAFLGRYYAHSGDDDALMLARRYLQLSVDGGPDQWNFAESRQICKFAWGTSVLSQVDPDNDYTPYLTKMVRWFTDCQELNGRWLNSSFYGPTNLGWEMDITSEFVVHLSTLLGALGDAKAKLNGNGKP